MPRKYAGPLQQGKRSAYVKGMRKNTKKTTTTKKTGLNKVEKKQVKKIISSRKESKYCPNWFAYDDYAQYGNFIQPRIVASSVLTGIYDQNNNACSCVGLQMGNYLNTASSQVNTLFPSTMYPLGGLGYERGDSSTTIDGDMAYLQSSQVRVQISALIQEAGQSQSDNVSTPLEFRVLHIKAKRDPAGTTPSLVGQLFLDLTNDAEGLGMSGSVKEIMSDYRPNTLRWKVKKDFKFCLQQPIKPSAQLITAGSNPPSEIISSASCAVMPSYPNQKELTFWLDKPKKKIRFARTDNGQNSYYEPLNTDLVETIIIICNRKTFYDSYSSSSSISSQATAKCWTISATGCTKVRDA